MSSRHHVTTSPVKKEILLCLLSAVLLTLSFPGFNIEFLAWVAFVPLFFALRDKSKGKTFLLSYICGVVFWLGTIYWLVHVTLPGMILLVLYLALYFGVFGLLISAVSCQLSAVSFFFIPSLWVLLEYLRSHLLTGFGWALLGYSQYLNLPIIQISDITGVWGVSFLAMMANVAIYQVTSDQSPVTSRELKHVLPVIICLFITLAYGSLKLHATRYTLHGIPVKVSVIQGNISQDLKWQTGTRDFILKKYLAISRMAAKESPDLIIWPEASLPVILEEEPFYYGMVSNFVRESRIRLLLGAVTLRDNLYYNSAILVSPEGRLANRYDKLHLVPFGEYIPLKKIFRFLETIVPIGDIAPGKEYTLFSLPTLYQNVEQDPLQTNFGVLICFEDIFPDLSRKFVRKGADFLVNITNDAWYRKTAASYQHFQASVFRAVENRVFLVRSANTGISGFISPKGEIISLVRDQSGREIFVDGYKTQEIIIDKQPLSLYTRFGDWFVLVCFIFVLWSIIVIIRKKSPSQLVTLSPSGRLAH